MKNNKKEIRIFMVSFYIERMHQHMLHSLFITKQDKRVPSPSSEVSSHQKSLQIK